MATRTIVCRDHGGNYTYTARPGRPPVRCTKENPCVQADKPASRIKTVKDNKGSVVALRGPSRVERTASAIKNGRAAARKGEYVKALEDAKPQASIDSMTVSELRKYADTIGMSTGTKLTSARQLRTAIRAYQSKQREQSTPEAQTTPTFTDRDKTLKRLHDELTPRDWYIVVTQTEAGAVVKASRGSETLIIIVSNDGKLVSQDYQLWDVDRPQRNDKPASKLPFDPDECTDRMVAQLIAGMKVTWWNRLARAAESAVVGDDIRITHNYNGRGDEVPGNRIISFTDRNGSGFRSFRLDALIKLGEAK